MSDDTGPPGKVYTLPERGAVTPTISNAVTTFEQDVRFAIDAAKQAGVPLGLIVAVMAGHTHLVTAEMCR